jgi:Na+/H+ antiporter NhaD/arsenite permease-like protein
MAIAQQIKSYFGGKIKEKEAGKLVARLLYSEFWKEVIRSRAASSKIAGNLFILGAASNVIIIQNAEKENETLTFIDFARVGVPLTILNLLVYMIFL